MIYISSSKIDNLQLLDQIAFHDCIFDIGYCNSGYYLEDRENNKSIFAYLKIINPISFVNNLNIEYSVNNFYYHTTQHPYFKTLEDLTLVVKELLLLKERVSN